MNKSEKEPEVENSEREVPSKALMGLICPLPFQFPFRRKPKAPKKPIRKK